MDTPPCS